MKYFIYCANGYFESTDKLNSTLIHMVEIGLIKIIVDVEAKKAWRARGDGTAEQVTVTNVSGLD